MGGGGLSASERGRENLRWNIRMRWEKPPEEEESDAKKATKEGPRPKKDRDTEGIECDSEKKKKKSGGIEDP